MSVRNEAIPVSEGAVPTALLGPEDGRDLPGLLVIPSIFGPAPDLLERLEPLAGAATIAVPDPFWRVGGGVVPYDDPPKALSRLQGFDLGACIADLTAVLEALAARSNGRVVALGICFGGPFVLGFAREGRLAGGVCWHGSRLEGHLEGVEAISCPLRLHFGGADAITPPAAIAAVREALAGHPDCEIVVHPGADHGYSHEGPAWDARAARAGLEAVAELLAAAR